MILLDVRRFPQTSRLFFVGILLFLCELWIAPGYGQTDRHIDKLIRQLNDRNQNVQQKAASELVQIGKPAVAPLVASLSSIQSGPVKNINILVHCCPR
jgi:hypothetical protein